jgi:hypothetical protein
VRSVQTAGMDRCAKTSATLAIRWGRSVSVFQAGEVTAAASSARQPYSTAAQTRAAFAMGKARAVVLDCARAQVLTTDLHAIALRRFAWNPSRSPHATSSPVSANAKAAELGQTVCFAKPATSALIVGRSVAATAMEAAISPQGRVFASPIKSMVTGAVRRAACAPMDT